MPVNDTRVTACHGGCGKQVPYTTQPRVSCPECRAAKKKERRAAYYEKHKEAEREAGRLYHLRNKARRVAENRAWKQANREKVRAYKREYAHRSPAEILNNRMRAAMNQRFRIWKGGRSWHDMVGYTPDELAAHLERQFTKGMGWENVGDWHIDHIVPLASFQFESVDDPEFKRAWSLANLRPLWGKDNRAKWANRTHLI